MCPEFNAMINKYDIICVQESKLDDVDSVEIQGYEVFMHNRKRISRHRSGGIALIVKTELLPYIKVINSKSQLIVWFGISKLITLNNEDMYCGIVYIPPIRSKYAHEDPYLEIQHEIERVCTNSKTLLLCGDFNSRTSNLEDFVHADSFINEMYGNYELTRDDFEILNSFERNNIALIRVNADTIVNAYGYKMIEFCKNNDVFILKEDLEFKKLLLNLHVKTKVP